MLSILMSIGVTYSFESDLAKRLQQERNIDMLNPDAIREYLTSLIMKDLNGGSHPMPEVQK